ncbi:hypothetical protein MMYC01_204961 [Madurella mycetomatis]|uniref:Uncharacterized protein n=1 Tax=Madurella mycetomatis TaxID=100816 RepID=A0A175W4R2_9PEZI|nr:hypothetical protein MMYC01_204961 [Madurella mycetomatis]
MCRPPSNQTARDMLGPVLAADTTISQIQPAPSIPPQRIYQVDLSDGRSLHLVLPPLSLWRPLRFEQGMVASEAAAVRWIASQQSSSSSSQSHSSSTSTSTFTACLPEPPEPDDPDSPSYPFFSLLPTLLHHGQEKSNLLGSSFAVYSPTPAQVRSVPLALLLLPPSPGPRSASAPAPLSQRERHRLDRQTGALFRHLAGLTSPSGRFGPLAAVVGSHLPPRNPLNPGLLARPGAGVGGVAGGSGSGNGGPGGGGGGGLMTTTGGAGTWSVAFHAMLEGILRDGEDMAVVLGYSTIRRIFRRLGYLLDEVRTARLVVVEGGGNVMVEVDERKGEGEEGGDGTGKGEEQGLASKEGEEDKKQEEVKRETGGGEHESWEGETKGGEKGEANPLRNLNVTGLRDWSSCVFGDPLLATVFSDPQQQPPSAGFLEGFNGKKPQQKLDAADIKHIPLNRDIIEAVDTAWIRLLLYQAYHSVVHIVSEFYRPRPDSSTRELEARRKLNEVLARLAEVADDAKRRHQRPSGEMSPAKRIKAEPED